MEKSKFWNVFIIFITKKLVDTYIQKQKLDTASGAIPLIVLLS